MKTTSFVIGLIGAAFLIDQVKRHYDADKKADVARVRTDSGEWQEQINVHTLPLWEQAHPQAVISDVHFENPNTPLATITYSEPDGLHGLDGSWDNYLASHAKSMYPDNPTDSSSFSDRLRRIPTASGSPPPRSSAGSGQRAGDGSVSRGRPDVLSQAGMSQWSGSLGSKQTANEIADKARQAASDAWTAQKSRAGDMAAAGIEVRRGPAVPAGGGGMINIPAGVTKNAQGQWVDPGGAPHRNSGAMVTVSATGGGSIPVTNSGLPMGGNPYNVRPSDIRAVQNPFGGAVVGQGFNLRDLIFGS